MKKQNSCGKNLKWQFLKALSSLIVFLFGFSTTLMAQYGVVETEYLFNGKVISETTGEKIEGIKLTIKNGGLNNYGNRMESASDGSFQIYSFMHSDISDMEILAEDTDGELNGGRFKPATVKVLQLNGEFLQDPQRQGSWHHYYNYSEPIIIAMQQETPALPEDNTPADTRDSVRISGNLPEITVEADTSEPATAGLTLEPVIENQDVLIYPNPAKGIITIELSTSETQDICITLFDERSRLLKSIIIKAAEGNVVQRIDMSGYASGTYYIKIEGKNFRASGKVIRG